MSKPKLVLQVHLEKQRSVFNTLTNISFDELPFLTAEEGVFNMKGEKVSKSYFDLKGREAVRINYLKIIGDHSFEGVDYLDQFLGLQKTICFIDWAGEVGYKKNKQPYYFKLEPVYNSGVVTSFSSQKQRSVLKAERYSADDYLQSKNPDLYALLYGRYTLEYEAYLRTGQKADLVSAIGAEVDANVLAVFNMVVNNSSPEITVKELILISLQ